MCTQIYKVYSWKNETENTNWGRVYSYHELIGEVAFLFGIQLQLTAK